MPITGNLDTMGVAELLQLLVNGRQTGTLSVTNGEIEKKIFLQEGEIVSSSSTDPKGFLGQFLISKGVISEEILAHAMAIQEKQGGMLGEILVEGGALDREKLDHLLRVKAEENICDLFVWEDGSFEFVEGELPDYKMVRITASITSLLMEGSRRIDHANKIKEVIPSPQCVPVAVDSLIDEDEMDMGWRGVLEAVNDDRSIEDITLHTHSSEFFVCEVLFEKVIEGRLKIVRPRIVAAEPSPVDSLPESDREPHTAAVSEGGGLATSAEALIAEANAHLKIGAYETAARQLRASASLDPQNRELGLVIKELEAEVMAGIEEDGITPAAVPVLETTLDDLRAMSFSPEEGFILSRITGTVDIGSIVKTSPLSELDSLLVFWKLARAGHIALKDAR
jgi:hypothetical protein